MKDFIFVKTALPLKDITIKQYEIGIVKTSSETTVLVQFVNHKEAIELSRKNVSFFDPLETGDEFSRKICNRCNRLLPTGSFQKNQTAKGDRPVRRPSCNDCRKEIDGTKVSKKDERTWESVKPSFDIWECPICKKRTIPGLTSKVVLDHDHKTGKPRAWICDSCNTGLGRFKDDIETIESAITYLKEIK